MKPIFLLFLAPLLLGIDIYLFTCMSELLRQNSDVGVIAGLMLGCTIVAGNFYLINFLINKFKPKQ